MITKLLEEIDSTIIVESKYSFKGQPVPRVTEILSSMLHDDYLLDWANRLGLYSRKKHTEERDRAALIGTWTHDFIDRYINDIKEFDHLSIPNDNIMKFINTAVSGFKLWYDDICKNNIINIIGTECEIVCPWFGGTYDMIININGKNYLTDFKTSNHISYKYFLQLAAYKYILNNYYNIQIDGFIILQLDKKSISYEEYVLDFNIKEHSNFMLLCTNTFLSLVYSYYNRLCVERDFKKIF